MAIGWQDGIDPKFRRREVGQDLFDATVGDEAVDNEIGVTGDAQSHCGAFGEDISVVGIDPAADREPLEFAGDHELPGLIAGSGGVAEAFVMQ